tara:strand:- start:1419 stop:2198 length:780 start_codon:yes stop_codon:yes gene_type:complete
MICLSKNLTDQYINMFAQGAKLPVYDYDYNFGDEPIVIRSMGKRKLIKQRWRDELPFYYMDSGYFGNYPCKVNPNGWKLFHRIVKNDVQHNKIIERPADRWLALDLTLQTKRKNGNHILVVVPSEKPCKFYDLDLDSWKHRTIREIKKHTDRPIVIREKTNRRERVFGQTIFDALKDCHALVTFQSIAAVESVMYGVPAFTTAPTAADPVCDKDLSLIEYPSVQDDGKIWKWVCHLAYGQFHIDELKNGTAFRILNENS